MNTQVSLVDTQRSKKGSYSKSVEKAREEVLRPDAAPKKRLNVKVPEPLYIQFQEKANAEGRTMTWYVLRWIEDAVSTRE